MFWFAKKIATDAQFYFTSQKCVCHKVSKTQREKLHFWFALQKKFGREVGKAFLGS
jgi:hypothetical protein